MSVSNRKQRSGKHDSTKKARRPQARKFFFEALEDRRVMAFTPGDVFAGSLFAPYRFYNITGGGDLSAETALANLGGATTGQVAWSRDLETAYVSVSGTGSVVAIDSSGAVSTFASGLSNPTGLILTSDDRLLVAENSTGQVTDITAGGDFTGATAFASGLSAPRNMVQLADGRILVTETGTGEVTDLGSGGNSFRGCTVQQRGNLRFRSDGWKGLQYHGRRKFFRGCSVRSGAFFPRPYL
jgi:glucose/arabinose dehydrogenase